eukprot:CAMPEP_0169396280 /NCGR_PEP_ID=MMETSP1017-20121227/51220_1 /TAXON_ID=342587 /ORGANISM="Karlodinium micrum, Strain CCMP2283" /LENGTH=71 /DNA_ID=CAMNT_0009500581 /DNA_START=109 /DNA_END=321 /DNA_ORIENTATION=-
MAIAPHASTPGIMPLECIASASQMLENVGSHLKLPAWGGGKNCGRKDFTAQKTSSDYDTMTPRLALVGGCR